MKHLKAPLGRPWTERSKRSKLAFCARMQSLFLCYFAQTGEEMFWVAAADYHEKSKQITEGKL